MECVTTFLDSNVSTSLSAFFSAFSSTGETGGGGKGGGGGGSSAINAEIPEGIIGINPAIACGVGVVISFGSYD